MHDIVSFGEWVQTRRNQLRYTRKAFAELVGCAPITIKKIERDERKPSVEMAELLAAHLQIPESEQEDFVRRARGEFVPHMGSPTEMSLDEAQAPASEEEAAKHNLPAQSTLFFGRETELDEIATKLADPACRLLTILGAGGMGKTRLSIEAAAAQLDNFTDGVAYVELARIGAVDSEAQFNPLAGALADALSISFHGRDTPERQLFTYLRRKEMLIVFDNFEDLVETAVFLSDLLNNAPEIKIIVTSRERLNLQHEWLFALQGLTFQESNSFSREVTNTDAMQLFVQRARQVKPSFNVDTELLGILRICQLVEGMPLGLELAAAWVFQLPCTEIAHEIEAEIGFLATQMRDLPERHRSLQAVFDYTWQKLTVREQDVLQKLSVFRGGFDRKAAKAVAGASLTTLASLTGKSLLTLAENSSFGELRTPRYSIHELLRQFAADKLAQQDSLAQETWQRHGHYFLNSVLERGFDETDATLEAVTQNINNVRAAIRWRARHQPHSFDYSMAYVLTEFFEFYGWLLEAETTFRMIVDQLLPDCLDPQATENKEVQQSCFRVATFQMGLAGIQWRLNQLQEAEESAQLALQWLPITEELAVQALRAESNANLGIIKFGQGALVQALNFCQRAGEFYQEVGDQISFGSLLKFQNIILLNKGEFDAAEEFQGLMQQIAVEMDHSGLARAKWNELGKLATIRGQLDEAEAYFDQSLEQFTEINQRPNVAYVLRERGEVSRLKGDYAEAREYAQRSMAVAKDINMPYPTILSLWLLGNIAVDVGQFETALHYFAQYEQISAGIQEQIGGPGWAMLGLGRLEEAGKLFAVALQKLVDHQARPIGLDALVGGAHIKARTGQLEEALVLLALVRDHPSSHYESKKKASQLWEELAADLPAELIAEAEARGRELDLLETAKSLLDELNGRLATHHSLKTR